MQYAFFRIPTANSAESTSELNRFLSSHAIASVEKTLVQDGANSHWAFAIAYEGRATKTTAQNASARKEQIDYREVLNERDFALFAQLRQLRKSLAEQGGVPAYAVFTNEQLAAMVTGKISSLTALQSIEGVGNARVERYGKPMLERLRRALEGSLL